MVEAPINQIPDLANDSNAIAAQVRRSGNAWQQKGRARRGCPFARDGAQLDAYAEMLFWHLLNAAAYPAAHALQLVHETLANYLYLPTFVALDAASGCLWVVLRKSYCQI